MYTQGNPDRDDYFDRSKYETMSKIFKENTGKDMTVSDVNRYESSRQGKITSAEDFNKYTKSLKKTPAPKPSKPKTPPKNKRKG